MNRKGEVFATVWSSPVTARAVGLKDIGCILVLNNLLFRHRGEWHLVHLKNWQGWKQWFWDLMER